MATVKEVNDAIRASTTRIVEHLAKGPLVDTWGCTHAAHLMTIVERLGLVSSMVQEVAASARDGMPGAELNYRRDLADQLTELGANVVVMLEQELSAIRARS